MKCPQCSTVDLSLAERQGVEIDYCPECRGVWLDRGELDKIIEKSQSQAQPVYPEQQSPYGDYRPQQHESRNHDDDDYRKHGYHKKKSWLSEIFD